MPVNSTFGEDVKLLLHFISLNCKLEIWENTKS
jgi:hypothetical protein